MSQPYGPPGQQPWTPPPNPYVAQGPVPGASPRSAGVAVLLSFLWLGAGHLYAGRVGAGVALAVYHLVLVVLAVSVVGLLVAVPLWLVSAPVVMVLAAGAANRATERTGSPRR